MNPETLIAQAQKKVASGGGFLSSMFGSQATRYEEASELYQQAANQYKIKKNWKGAGDAFVEAAKLQEKLPALHEAAKFYSDAANCYKKVDQDEYAACTQRCVDIYSGMGRFLAAGKAIVQLAEVYETQIVDLDRAVELYEQAADMYMTEDSSANANKARLKVAHLAAQKEDFEKAFEVFEDVAAGCVDNSLLKWSAKEYFLKAGLCRLCVDLVDAQQRIATYEQQFATFRDSREQKLLLALANAVEEGDIDKYTTVVREYNAVSPLDAWMTSVLLKIKKSIDNDDLL